jgi:hypothetical protein
MSLLCCSTASIWLVRFPSRKIAKEKQWHKKEGTQRLLDTSNPITERVRSTETLLQQVQLAVEEQLVRVCDTILIHPRTEEREEEVQV